MVDLKTARTVPVVVVALLVLQALFAGTADPAAHGNLGDPSALARGKFLIAGRNLNDPNFGKTVVLLVQYGPGGALGLILNRPTPMKLGEILPDLEGPGTAEQIYFGGPVSPGSLGMLVGADTAPSEAEEVIAGVHFSRSRPLLDRLAGKKKNVTFRVFAGYAGWAAGQLDAEVERGDWYVVGADAGAVFPEDAQGLWRLLIPADPKRSASLRSPVPSRRPMLSLAR